MSGLGGMLCVVVVICLLGMYSRMMLMLFGMGLVCLSGLIVCRSVVSVVFMWFVLMMV